MQLYFILIIYNVHKYQNSIFLFLQRSVICRERHLSRSGQRYVRAISFADFSFSSFFGAVNQLTAHTRQTDTMHPVGFSALIERG